MDFFPHEIENYLINLRDQLFENHQSLLHKQISAYDP